MSTNAKARRERAKAKAWATFQREAKAIHDAFAVEAALPLAKLHRSINVAWAKCMDATKSRRQA